MTLKDALTSERMIFGLLIIVGLEVDIFALALIGPHLPAEIVTLIAGGMGALSAAIGIIVQAIWKTDRTDAKQAETAAILAAKAPDQSGLTVGPPS